MLRFVFAFLVLLVPALLGLRARRRLSHRKEPRSLSRQLTSFITLLENPALARGGRIQLTPAGEDDLTITCSVAPKGVLLETVLAGPTRDLPAALLEQDFPPELLEPDTVCADFDGRELVMTASAPCPTDWKGELPLHLAASLAPQFPQCRLSHTRESVYLRLWNAVGPELL